MTDWTIRLQAFLTAFVGQQLFRHTLIALHTVEIIHTQTLANPTEVAERAVVNVPTGTKTEKSIYVGSAILEWEDIEARSSCDKAEDI